jgi:hypothetical protein
LLTQLQTLLTQLQTLLTQLQTMPCQNPQWHQNQSLHFPTHVLQNVLSLRHYHRHKYGKK